MDGIVLILGLVGVAGLFLYLASIIDSRHEPLKLMAVLFFATLLILVGKASLDYEPSCEIVVNTTQEDYFYNSSTNNPDQINISHTYMRHCESVPNSTTATTFYRVIIWFVVILFSYVSYGLLACVLEKATELTDLYKKRKK